METGCPEWIYGHEIADFAANAIFLGEADYRELLHLFSLSLVSCTEPR